MTSTKSFISFHQKWDRVIVLVDMDCFYCQVEEKLNPELKGKPIAVVQYNEYKGGGIIAVNYPARYAGVSRHMRGDEAKEHCPDLVLCKVPNVRGKADLSKYRDAGKDVAQVLQTFTPLLERASVDEAYLDITDTVISKLHDMNDGNFKLDANRFEATYPIGYNTIGDFVKDLTKRCLSTSPDSHEVFEDESEYEKTSYKRSDLKLLIGAVIANDIRAAVKEKTGFECSAGIAHNKILAKLTAGMNKPNKQTIIPVHSIPELYATLPISKVKGLGGKFGEDVCEAFKIKLMSELAAIPKESLLKKFEEKNGNWLYLISRGVDLECVTPKFNSKSIGCCKKFPGITAIVGIASLNHWLLELATEICERMDKDTQENNRKAKQMVVSYTQTIGSEDISSSRTVTLNYYEAEPLARDALEVIKRNTSQFFKPDNPGSLNNHIKFLGISVTKFEEIPETNKNNVLKEMFKNQLKKTNSALEETPSTSKKSENFEESEQQSSETTLSEIMLRKQKSSSVECINKANEDSVNAVPIHKSKSLLESMFENQKKRNDEEKTEQENNAMNSAHKSKDDSQFSSASTTINVENDKPSTSFITKHHDNNNDNQKVKEEVSCSSTFKNDTNEDADEDIILPEIEIPLIRCEICKRKIPEYEMDAHKDYHFALQVSQKQREDFRNAMKSKFSPNPNKKDVKTNELKNLPKIDAFLKKRNEDIDKNAVKCEECGKMVKDIIEHSDYHLARKLQDELRRGEIQSAQPNSGKKRKRSDSRSDKSNPVKVKTLTNFFSKAE